MLFALIAVLVVELVSGDGSGIDLSRLRERAMPLVLLHVARDK